MNGTFPRVLYARAAFDDREKKAVKEVLNTPEALVNGKFTNEFESRVSSLFGKSHGVMVNSGSSANLLAVEVASLPPGTEVVTPVVTFSTTVTPLLQKGLTPVFVDVGLGDYQIDVDQMKEAITPKTGALMIPNLLGNLPELNTIRDLADDHDLIYIEDSADTIGATYKGKQTGIYSDISTTSFYGSHVITAFGGGGMISVDSTEHRDRLRVLRGWGRSSASDESEDIEERYNNQLANTPYDSKFIFKDLGYNFLPLEASAAFGLQQIDKLDDFAAKRESNWKRLRSFFERYEEYFIIPEQSGAVKTSWLGFPITLRDSAPFDRMGMAKHLEHRNIQTRPLFSGNILKHPAFENVTEQTSVEAFPNADLITRGSIVLGCHQSLSEQQLSHVERSVEIFIEDH